MERKDSRELKCPNNPHPHPRNILNRKRSYIAHSLSLSTSPRPDMTETLLKKDVHRKSSIHLLEGRCTRDVPIMILIANCYYMYVVSTILINLDYPYSFFFINLYNATESYKKGKWHLNRHCWLRCHLPFSYDSVAKAGITSTRFAIIAFRS